MSDCAGFYAFRRYPPNTELAQIVTTDGRAAVRCYLAFIVSAPTQGSHISRVELKAWFARRWQPGKVFSSNEDANKPPPGHPDAPNPQSAVRLSKARKPIDLDSGDVEGFIYDSQEDIFIDADGKAVTPVQMLDEMYTKHCRTLRIGFRIRWNLGTAARWTIRQVVWRGQDAAMRALFALYDIELVNAELRDRKLRNPFHKYRPSDFSRATDKPGERSHFFGFQSSRKSFLTNLTVVVSLFLLAYWKASDVALLRAIYNNPALTTAALIFVFLVADTLGPWLLIRVVCALSRFRDAVLFFIRKVKV